MSDPMPTAVMMQELVKIPADTNKILRNTTLKAIYTASTLGNSTTAAINYSSADESELLGIFTELRGLGFTVTPGASSYTIGW